jgi:hypothetical protein
MAQHSSEDIDWVAAQAKCNAAAFFERFRNGIKQDVARRNALTDHPDRATFEYFEDDDGAIEVTRATGSALGATNVTAVVRMRRAGPRIEVVGEDVDVMLHAVLSLDPDGHCRVVIGEAMFAEWEFRRLALEQLFFQDAEPDDD